MSLIEETYDFLYGITRIVNFTLLTSRIKARKIFKQIQ